MPHCVLRYCTNNSRSVKRRGERITFHQFPHITDKRRDEWIEFVKIDRREPFWSPSSHSRVCSAHFRPSDFYDTKKGLRYLQKNAVPVNNPLEEPSPNKSLEKPSPKKTPQKKIHREETSVGNRIESNNIYLCACDSDADSEPEPEAEPEPLIKDEPIIRTKIPRRTVVKRDQNLIQKRIHYKNRIRKLADIIKKLKSKFLCESLIENEDTLLKQANVIDKYINVYQKFKQPGKEMSRHPYIRKFALTLYYYSARVYKYVRINYNNALPHPQELRKWYGSFNGEPGFSEEAFKALWLKSTGYFQENSMMCCLVFGEMAIRQQKLFKNEKLSYVNFGSGPQDEKATQALVFMLISLTENWKIPVGYFLTTGISAETKATLVKICLGKCHKVGIRVVCLTFEGSKMNFNTLEILGCKFSNVADMKTHFCHPYTFENVYVFVDPCYTIKQIRNAFEDKKIFFDENNKMIKWQLLVDLNKTQHNEEFRFADIRSPQHIQFRNQMMKIKLATQLLSTSVAKSLEFCDEILQSPQFLGSAGTDRFINLINSFSNIFNSQTSNFYGYQSPICCSNKDNIFELLNEVESYINSLQIQVKQQRVVNQPNQEPRITVHIMRKSIIESQFKTGFISAIVSIESLKNMYIEMVEEKQLMSYISTHRLSQEHLELFFGCLREHGKNDPNAIQFREAYTTSLNLLELRPSFTCNCLPIDNFPISSTTSVSIINSTSGSNRHENMEFQVYEKDNQPLNSDIEASVNCMILSKKLNSESLVDTSKLIIGYISGYVTRKLIKDITCEECITNLTADKKQWYHKLITLKDMGGLCYSSKNVFKVCLKTEIHIRSLIKENDGKSIHLNKINKAYIITRTLKDFIDTDIFCSMSLHSLQQPATFNHRTHLIRAIIEQYSLVRLHNELESISRIPFYPKRQRFTKLVLFEQE